MAKRTQTPPEVDETDVDADTEDENRDSKGRFTSDDTADDVTALEDLDDDDDMDTFASGDDATSDRSYQGGGRTDSAGGNAEGGKSAAGDSGGGKSAGDKSGGGTKSSQGGGSQGGKPSGGQTKKK